MSFSWWRKLSLQIPIIVLLATMLPLLIVGSIATRLTRNTLIINVAKQNQNIAADEVMEVEATLEHMVELTAVAAAQPTLINAEQDLTEQTNTMEQVLKSIPNAMSITLIDAQGDEFLKLSRLQVFLESDYQNWSGTPLFRQVMTGDFVIRDITLSENGMPMQQIAVPIWNVRRDDVQGVLLADYSLQFLMDQIVDRPIGESGHIIILDNENRLISHPDLSKVLAGGDYSALVNPGTLVWGTAENALYRYTNGEGIEMFTTHQTSDELGWTIVIEQSVAETLATNNVWYRSILSVIGVLLLVAIGMSLTLSRTFSTPLQLVTKAAQQISEGDVSPTLEIYTNNEIGLLADTFRKMVRYLKNASAQANQIAQGDFSNKVTPISDKDELGNALQEMTQTLRQASEVAAAIADGKLDVTLPVKGERDVLALSVNRMVGLMQKTAVQANAIAAGDYTIEMQPRSEADELSIALQKMVINLRQITQENQAQLWLAQGHSELNEQIRDKKNTAQLASVIIRFVCNYLKAPVGAIYVYQNEQTLRLEGSYAYGTAQGMQPQFALGEGIIGQVAAEKRPIALRDIPPHYLRVQSGLGASHPYQIIAIPLLYEGQLQAVLELGTLSELSDLQHQFLNSVAESIAVSFKIMQATIKTEELLVKTQQQTEEMAAQQEELRQTNEQLSQQAEALRLSEKELQYRQEELEATNEELEENAQQLEKQREIVELNNKQLRDAQQELEKRAEQLAITSKYKSEFLSNMSHELRTPLNSLLILARLLSDNEGGNLIPEQVESARIIYESGQDLLSLINEILDLSKIEAGKVRRELEAVSLTDLMKSMTRKFEHVGNERGVAFVTKLEEGLPGTIETDMKRLEQILRNLLSNAFKFTPSGSVTLRAHRPETAVFLPSLTSSDDVIALSVTDTGIGIAPENHDLVFEAFQQVDGTTSREYSGTGLGLSISRELAHLLGGELKLESALGIGSTFTLYLPIKLPRLPDAPTQVDPIPEAISPPSPKMTTLTHRATSVELLAPTIPDDRSQIEADDKVLLIVEDDDKFAKILINFGRQRGFKCIVASSGEQALLHIQQKPITAVLLDIQLPGMHGWEVLQWLKQNPDTRHIPVHMMSILEESIDAFRQGALGYLHKPAAPEDLDQTFQLLDQFLARDAKSILIVEDDPATLTSLRRLIGGQDVEIVEASQGKDALNLLQERPFDCMILDLKLPDMTGFQLLDRLTTLETPAKPPVIVYTGKELTQAENKNLMQYADTVIIKGVKSQERLLDETALFLHRIVANLPQSKQQMIRNLHHNQPFDENKKILLVDDDLRSSFALSRVLTDKGLQVEMAANGYKALTLLQEQPDIDLVLMDVMMPEMDGFEAISRIRKQPSFTHLPIIALTAKAMRGDREKCISAGANDYLAKPVDIDRLFSLLRVWLSA